MESLKALEDAIVSGRMLDVVLPDGEADRIIPRDIYLRRGRPVLAYYSDRKKQNGEAAIEDLHMPNLPTERLPADGRLILTVSDLTRRLKAYVDEGPFQGLWVQGELTQVKYHYSGHVYFTLKDEETSIDVSLFRGNASRLPFRLEAGLKVELYGRADVWQKTTKLGFIAERVNPAGQGPLQLAYEQMKKRLEQEGLFDPARKRPIPPMPDVVGIITSSTGAVLQDILRTTRVHFPAMHLILYPAAVQGDQAPDDLKRALELAQADGRAQVLIVCRGGGSAEDLLPFNSETVARAIAGCRIPVISAVGHETDFTIADFAADFRCATPTAAAEKVTQAKGALAENRRHLARRTANAMWGRVIEIRERLKAVRPARVAHLLGQNLRDMQRSTDYFEEKAIRAAQARLKDTRERFRQAALRAYALSPGQVLGRGYAVVRFQGTAVLDGHGLKEGDQLEIAFHRGRRQARITGTTP